MAERPLVWAHRGASGCCPENTLAAFQKAADLGADGVELDIHLTKDGAIVVTHDERIDRVSDHTGRVCDYTLDELKSFDFCNGNLAYEGIQIPTMGEVFELLEPTGLTINIELKTGEIFYEGIEEKIAAMTRHFGMEDRVIYSSFNHCSVMRMKQVAPKARTGFLYADGTLDMPAYAQAHGVDALHPAVYNLQYEEFMEECRRRKVEVNVWTVNTVADLQTCVRAGVHAVITNYPDKARRVMEKD